MKILSRARGPVEAEAKVSEGEHYVEVEDEAEAQVDEVDHDVDGYALPMSIYSPFITFVCNLLRSFPRSD